MIFVTVGTQIPFDRLVRTVDEWAGACRRSDVFAQIGKDGYQPLHFPAVELLSPAEFRQRLSHAQVVVSHAGMGTILTVLEAGLPLVVMPRQQRLGEVRNEHQRSTIARLQNLRSITVARDETELRRVLETIDQLSGGEKRPIRAAEPLLQRITEFVRQHRER